MLGLAAGVGDGQPVRHPIPNDTKIWLLADDIAGSDGDSVASWPDHMGASPFVQATAGKKPLLKKGANGMNGHNVVRFDGTDDIMTGSTVSMTGKAMPVVFAINTTNLPHETQVVFSPNDNWGGAEGFGMMFYGDPGGPPDTFPLGITYSGIPFGATTTSTGKVWVTYLKDATGWTINQSVGGSTQLTPADTNDVFIVNPHIGFNEGLSAFYQAFPGDIAELIVWNRKLSATEIGNVRANLSAKYGI